MRILDLKLTDTMFNILWRSFSGESQESQEKSDTVPVAEDSTESLPKWDAKSQKKGKWYRYGESHKMDSHASNSQKKLN